MEYQYSPYTGTHFATMLRRDAATRNLIWDNSKGHSVLVVQCRYGKNPFEMIEEICSAMSMKKLEEDLFTEVLPDVWVRTVTPPQKVRNKGCPLRGEASTYAVFGLEERAAEGTCVVYGPQSEKKSRLDIPAEIHIRITKETTQRRSGFLGRRVEEVETGFYVVDFPNSGHVGYNDGDLTYYVNKLQIPITKEMLDAGRIYLKTGSYPEIRSGNKGLKLIAE